MGAGVAKGGEVGAVVGVGVGDGVGVGEIATANKLLIPE